MRMLMTVFVFMGVVSLTACNTVRGMGQDIEKAGEAVKNAGSK